MCLIPPLVVALTPVAALSPAAHRTLIVLVLVTGLWLTEALPIWVTALLVPLGALVLGIADAKRAFASFGDPILFLFFGTFIITTACFDHGINARLARAVLGARFIKGSPNRLLWAIAALGLAISAWVNNTATTVLLLPLALSAHASVTARSRPALVPALLMTSYAPSICGIATPVGSAPNLIGLRLIEANVGAHVSFARWCALFAPLAAITTLLACVHLSVNNRRAQGVSLPPPPPDAGADVRRPFSRAEKILLGVCAIVVVLWIGPGLLQALPLSEHAIAAVKAFSGRLPEAAVPVLGALALFVLPGAPGKRLADPNMLQRLDWSTLLLFGGGLGLGSLIFETGLARWLGEGLFAALPFKNMFGIVLASTLMGVLLSEITSNTASASLVVPVVIALAQTARVDPVAPALAATVACSFGFMLPVSTPPNALVYSTGQVRMRDMIRYGVLLDIAGIALVSGWVTVFAT